jgi:hypothetical protein
MAASFGLWLGAAVAPDPPVDGESVELFLGLAAAWVMVEPRVRARGVLFSRLLDSDNQVMAGRIPPARSIPPLLASLYPDLAKEIAEVFNVASPWSAAHLLP